MKSKLPKQLPYPKILWYQITTPKPTEDEIAVVYNRHYDRLIEIYSKNYPTVSKKEIEDAAASQAIKAAEKEFDKPARIQKVLVQDERDHRTMIPLIEGQEGFIQWYEK